MTSKFLNIKRTFPDGSVQNTSIPPAPNRYVLVADSDGYNGFSWEPDPIGPIGPAGATGPTGPVGPYGNQGAVGDAGDQGLTGLTGVIGSTGGYLPPVVSTSNFSSVTYNSTTGAITIRMGVVNAPFYDAVRVGATITAVNGTGSVGVLGMKVNGKGIGFGGRAVFGLALGPGAVSGTIFTMTQQAEFLKGPTGPVGEQGQIGENGAKGPVGKVGSIGPQGDKGPTGPDGDKGATGGKGPNGAKGENGDQGDKGTNSTVQGPQGSPGGVGVKGPEGPEGLAGLGNVTGRMGDNGAPGNKGAIGDAGPAGKTGATGTTGFVGATGPAGQQGTNYAAGRYGIIPFANVSSRNAYGSATQGTVCFTLDNQQMYAYHAGNWIRYPILSRNQITATINAVNLILQTIYLTVDDVVTTDVNASAYTLLKIERADPFVYAGFTFAPTLTFIGLSGTVSGSVFLCGRGGEAGSYDINNLSSAAPGGGGAGGITNGFVPALFYLFAPYNLSVARSSSISTSIQTANGTISVQNGGKGGDVTSTDMFRTNGSYGGCGGGGAYLYRSNGTSFSGEGGGGALTRGFFPFFASVTQPVPKAGAGAGGGGGGTAAGGRDWTVPFTFNQAANQFQYDTPTPVDGHFGGAGTSVVLYKNVSVLVGTGGNGGYLGYPNWGLGTGPTPSVYGGGGGWTYGTLGTTGTIYPPQNGVMFIKFPTWNYT